jgi:hypothetical protein
LSRDHWRVRRISLRYLNENNAPDDIEKKILNDFSEKYSSGWKTGQLAWYKLSEIGNQSEFRYIQAAAYEDRCMTCHAAQQKDTLAPLFAYSVKKIEIKNYIPEPALQEKASPLPAFEE